MEFFGLGSAVEMETPLGKLVKSATDPLLLGPDWSKNLEICDSVSNFSEATEVVKAIFHQLKSSDTKVVQLAITLTDTCIQNCWQHIPKAINKSFMDEIVTISRGRKGYQNQEEALRLIQVWGRRFESKKSEVPIFFDTYMRLRSQGVNFPPEEDSSPSAVSRDNSRPSSVPSNTEVDKNAKLIADLNVVLEKIRLCREMLPESPGISNDEALSEVVGFLEACQERMIDLIEAGAQGLLTEELFEECLRVNDALARTLEAERDGTAIAVDEGTVAIGQSLNTENSSAANKKGPKAALLDDEADEFSGLTMKTSSKKSTGNKKIPAIKGPKESGQKSSGSLLPPPPGNQGRQQQQQKQSPNADLDFLSGSSTNDSSCQDKDSNNPFNNLPAPPAGSSQNNSNPLHSEQNKSDDVLDIFGSSSVASTDNKAPSTLGSSQMSDAEFESFLNSK